MAQFERQFEHLRIVIEFDRRLKDLYEDILIPLNHFRNQKGGYGTNIQIDHIIQDLLDDAVERLIDDEIAIDNYIESYLKDSDVEEYFELKKIA